MNMLFPVRSYNISWCGEDCASSRARVNLLLFAGRSYKDGVRQASGDAVDCTPIDLSAWTVVCLGHMPRQALHKPAYIERQANEQ
jgi:hypothetical protein